MTFVVTLWSDHGARCGVRHIVLQPTGGPGMEGVIQLLREGLEGATFDRHPPTVARVIPPYGAISASAARPSGKIRSRPWTLCGGGTRPHGHVRRHSSQTSRGYLRA